MISLFTVLLARETADSKHCGTAAHAAAFIRGGCYHPKPKSDAAEHPRVSMTFIERCSEPTRDSCGGCQGYQAAIVRGCPPSCHAAFRCRDWWGPRSGCRGFLQALSEEGVQ